MEDRNTSFSLQYCLLIVGAKLLSSKKEVTVDFGEQNSSLIKTNELIIEKTAKVENFYTVVDALNYMASIGWRVVHIMPFFSYARWSYNRAA